MNFIAYSEAPLQEPDRLESGVWSLESGVDLVWGRSVGRSVGRMSAIQYGLDALLETAYLYI